MQSKYKYTKTQLNRMRKEKLFSLCLKHYGLDTAYYYRNCTKADMVSDLVTVLKGE